MNFENQVGRQVKKATDRETKKKQYKGMESTQHQSFRKGGSSYVKPYFSPTSIL